jgi:hypothetical protein
MAATTTVIDSYAAALEREIVNLQRRYTLAMERATSMLADYTGRSASTHLGHNLGSVANEISELAAQIDQTTMLLRDLRTRAELGGGQ